MTSLPTPPEWLSEDRTKTRLEGFEDLPKLEEAFFLSVIASTAFCTSQFQADLAWVDAIKLTPYGEARLVGYAQSADARSLEANAFAVFRVFFHREIMIDWQKCDLVAIRKLLEAALATGELRLPHSFGRELYDRFNDMDVTTTDHIATLEAENLTSNIEQGVFQFGNIVTGPLGLLNAEADRYIPPRSAIPLWHCSDPGCNAQHGVELLSNEKFTADRRALYRFLVKVDGLESEWRKPLVWAHYDRSVRGGMPMYNLPALVADSVIGNELSSLFVEALKRDKQKVMRSALSRAPRRPKDGEGAPEALAKTLTDRKKLQLLWLLSPRVLVGAMEWCVANGAIQVPSSVTLVARTAVPRRSYKDRAAQASALGLRARVPSPVAELATKIWRAYEGAGLASELNWKVKDAGTLPAREATMAFIRTKGPATAVESLVLASKAISKIFGDELQVEIETEEPKALLLERMLWKLGFDVPRGEELYTHFRQVLSTFRQEVMKQDKLSSEGDRDRVRAAANNMFVALEEIIQSLIVFNVWALASDHFAVTRFIYDWDEAIKLVPTFLGARLPMGEEYASWDVNGRNSFGVLLRYLAACTAWIESLENKTTEDLRRPDEDLPHFIDDPSLPFPLLHRQLWADADRERLGMFASIFRAAASRFLGADIAAVRNGCAHRRPASEFPDMSMMLASATNVQEGFDRADMNRLLPKLYWTHEFQRDRYGSSTISLIDYNGAPLVLHGPPGVIGLKEPEKSAPVLVCPGSFLPYPNSELIFLVREPCAYTRYWRGYPRKRHLPPRNGTTTESNEDTPGATVTTHES